MKHIFLLFVILMVGCSMPTRFSNHLTPEEKGYGCLYSFFSVRNVTDTAIHVVIDTQTHEVQKGKKLKQRLTKGKHKLCVNNICEDFTFYPCMAYDFTPTLL